MLNNADILRNKAIYVKPNNCQARNMRQLVSNYHLYYVFCFEGVCVQNKDISNKIWKKIPFVE